MRRRGFGTGILPLGDLCLAAIFAALFCGIGRADELLIPVPRNPDWATSDSTAAPAKSASSAPARTPSTAPAGPNASATETNSAAPAGPNASTSPTDSSTPAASNASPTQTNPAAPVSSTPRFAAPLDSTLASPSSAGGGGVQADPAVKILQLRLRLQKNPDDAEAMGKLGLALLDRARATQTDRLYSEADSVFHRCLARDSLDFAGLFGLGSLSLSRHDFRQALAWGEKGIRKFPRNAPILGILVDANVELGRYPEATRNLDEMLKVRPGLTSCSRVSYIRELYGDLDGAETAMAQAADAGQPGAPEVAWCRAQLGDLYFRHGKLPEAERAYRAADAEFPGYPRAMAGLAHLAEASGDLDAAQRLLEAAVDGLPLAQFLIDLGDLHAARGERAAAERCYAQVRQAAEDARANGLNVDLEMAVFEVDHGADPGLLAARAADTYARRPSVQAAHMYAWVLYRAGRITEARHLIENALRLGTRDPELDYHAGMIYRAEGNVPKAREFLERALSLNPSFSLADGAKAREALGGLPGSSQPDGSSYTLNATKPLLTVNPVDVVGARSQELAALGSASQGQVTSTVLQTRPLLRAGDVMETVPGVLVSQHSGEGKANQYYLRGFNLDHGTDMSLGLDGVPVNLPTHGHGQGYADLNFLIPELVSDVEYRKGTYAADEGDFSAAGDARIRYRSSLDASQVKLTTGGEGYRRALLAGSTRLGGGQTLGALEVSQNDGPWIHPDRYQKVNGVLRFSEGDAANHSSITAMGYNGGWNSTDQVPERALADGEISRFGAIDPTDGGHTHRYSLSAETQRTTPRSLTRANAYVFAYKLNLFSDFTYFLEDPVHGDQFEQADQRVVAGFDGSQLRKTEWWGRPVRNTFGFQARNDAIGNVGLYHTEHRERLGTVRQDRVMETSAASFWQNEVSWMPKLRTIFGLRGDAYHFNVNSNLQANSGKRDAGLVSPKLSCLLGPWKDTEIFANYGYGFHSNDARGTTIRVDPKTGEPVQPVTSLVRAKGAELGVKGALNEHLSGSLTVWNLDLASELLFTGDAGTTEPSRPSRRTGVEILGSWTPVTGLVCDGSFNFSRARFTNFDTMGNRIPGAVGSVISSGLSWRGKRRLSASVRARYFGPRPLIEDNSVRSRASFLLSSQLGYRIDDRWSLACDGFNLLDAKTSDIDYYYTSRLPGEPAGGVADIHTHPTASRSIRVSVTTDLRP